MTEKRFTVKSQDDYFGVIDNNVGDNVCVVNGIHTLIETEWLCEVLNSLINENEQLKARIEYLERKIQRERTSAMKEHEKWEKEAETKIKELSEENEQLKSDKKLLIDFIKKEFPKSHKHILEGF